jgi:predicted ATPase
LDHDGPGHQYQLRRAGGRNSDGCSKGCGRQRREPGTLLIAGEADVGRTRLLQEFADRIGNEALVLFGSCLLLTGGGLPYGPIVDALRPLALDLDPAELNELLGPTPDDLARLLPGATPPRSARLAEPVSEFAQARLFELLLHFLDRLGRRRPLVLVVEDAHWADRSILSAWLAKSA